MSKESIFKNVLQVAVVVDDLEETVKTYADGYGIGPWKFYTFDPSTVDDMVIRGEKQEYSMKIAVCKIGNVEWELIEPLDNKSIYAEFLEEHGEGLHHVAFESVDHDETLELLEEKGINVLQAGSWAGERYTYLDTEDSLSFIAEIYRRPEGFEKPEPEKKYPKNS